MKGLHDAGQDVEIGEEVLRSDVMGQGSWDDSYRVHIEEIDSQHEVLVSIIDDLKASLDAGESREMVGRVVGSLMTYSISHFSFEERLFEKYKYPGAEKHIMEHDTFVMRVSDFKRGYDEGHSNLKDSVLSYLSNWLLSHIKSSDTECGAFLISKGVE